MIHSGMNKPTTPPKLPLRFFRWFCHPDYVEDIEGDLLERFERRMDDGKAAKWLFTVDVVKLFRPGIVRPFDRDNLERRAMIIYYWKITHRNLLRHKAFSAINLSGLVIGMVAALLLAKYVGFTFSYDQFHANRDRLVLIDQTEARNGVPTSYQHSTYSATAAMAKERYPEVVLASLYHHEVEMKVAVLDDRRGLVKFNERRIASVAPDFTLMFSFQFIQGNPATALLEPGSVVITRSTAEKYFNGIQVLGRTMQTTTGWGEEETLHVTGVIEDLPVYSSLQFDFLKSSVGHSHQDAWDFAAYDTYLLLRDGAARDDLATKMTDDINRLDQLKGDQRTVSIGLVPVGAPLFSDMEVMLAIVGLFILLITWINFINLTSAQALSRHREAGLRKVLGSTRGDIVRQFIFEGMAINLLAMGMAALIVWLLYPFLHTYTGGRILPLFNDPTPVNWIFFSFFLLGVLIASYYPSLALSALDPARSIKGQVLDKTRGIGFRQVLVVLQFSISVILITGIFVISDQMNFMKGQDLGIRLDQTLVVKTAKDHSERWMDKLKRLQTFKESVANLSFARGVTSSTQVPGEGNGQDIYFSVEGRITPVSAYLMGVDLNYMSYYGAKIIAGTDFTGGFRSNRRSILINRSTAVAMGCSRPEEAIGQKITIPENDQILTVLGVVEDFHQNSLKEEIQPMTFEYNPARGHISIRIDSAAYANYQGIREHVAQIESIWNDVYPDQVFEYFFLDERFNGAYEADIKFKQLFSVFTGISVFIACLGLLGMSMFIGQKKRRQVGIRKVFGASVLNIIALFCRGYFGQIAIAVLVGSPVAYLVMHKWLESYVLRTSVSLSAVLLPIALLVVVSFVSISGQVITAATANPIDALRDE